jgi:hypothetical protein
MARHQERAENRPGFVRRDHKAILPTKLGQEHRILAASREDLSPPREFPTLNIGLERVLPFLMLCTRRFGPDFREV